MKLQDSTILLSASDLSGHIGCSHLTQLDLAAAQGFITAPEYLDPMLELLQERGQEFENQYLKTLKDGGLLISEPIGDESSSSLTKTREAMERGVDVIYQASLRNGNWQGRADFLIKVDKPSRFGAWSYEVVDSKLAKETRTGTILQLCLYSEIIADIQGVKPEFMHVITPEESFKKHSYRLDDFLAYYRFVKNRLEKSIEQNGQNSTYPIPCPQCDVCKWWKTCDSQRREDDHLSLVAGLSNTHIKEFEKWGIHTLEELAGIPIPLSQKPSKGASETYVKLREQARVQLEARVAQKPVYEILLPLEQGRGLSRLPEPSEGDLFFDFESDPFVGTQGIEYLFGWVLTNETPTYHSLWSFTLEQEKSAFEQFVDMVVDRWKQYPDLHIYHFTAFEPATLKRLMGKHGTRENEIDNMLRAGLFIDLHSIARQSIRAGVEAYSLKELEVFHNFVRSFDLRQASLQLRTLEGFLERNILDSIPKDTINAVQTYNMEDCLSTRSLREWLEKLRSELISSGKEIERPPILEGEAGESVTEHQERIKPIFDALMSGVPVDPLERTPEQQANWLLAHMLDWYRREKKSVWWEFFRLRDMPDEEMIEEKAAISGLSYTGHRQDEKRSIVDTYQFPPQDFDIREGEDLKSGDGSKFGSVFAIDGKASIIQIKKSPSIADNHPKSVFKHNSVNDGEKEEAIIRIAEWVAENGIDADGPYRAGLDLLMCREPRTDASFKNDEDPQKKAVAWVEALENGVLPIQGPPGTGKSHTAAEMILALIQSGKKVGITALSHKVISGLMQKVVKAGKDKGKSVRCLQKVSTPSIPPNPDIVEVKDNQKVVSEIKNFDVIGGTAWLWTRPDMAESVDVLFVDEAGQLSLIDTVAVSQSANNLVLLGDPQQLKQPQQGTHPEGTEVSALEHILKENKTIPPDKGIFLDVTWRLHPKICDFVSELFYESRLKPRSSMENQALVGSSSFAGSGLWFIPVTHEGNQSSSSEEVEAVSQMLSGLLNGSVSYSDFEKKTHPLTVSDIKVIAPYNAQVNQLVAKVSPSIQVGTVDKFQGQEAPVILFSMATSAPEDAPRGMEFLYSLNRLNVAASRARACFILVASPKLFEPESRSVDQMKLANAFCRYLEMSN